MISILNNKLKMALLVPTMFLISCEEKDPLPLSEAAFHVVTESPEKSVGVKFENLSTNSSYYQWDFGDDSPTSKDIAPIHIYDVPGSYTVTLQAFTEDNQVTTATKEVNVGERYLTGMFIININPLDSKGKIWDNDGSGPDVLMQFGPVNFESDEQIEGFYVDSLNVGSFQTPIGISTIDVLPTDVKLGDEEYFILLEEVDTVNNQPSYTKMVELQFNPVVNDGEVIIEVVRGNGTGDLTIPFVVVNQYQFFLEFQVR